jgi:uncharacterized membrane protein YjjP (DUF1212 family)
MVNTLDDHPMSFGKRFFALTTLLLPAASLVLGALLALAGDHWVGFLVTPVAGGAGVQWLPGLRDRSGSDRFLWTLLAAGLTTLAAALWVAAIGFALFYIACHDGGCFD